MSDQRGGANIKKTFDKLMEFKNSQLNIEGLMLFGSRAKGMSHEYSDVDILVISPIFQKMTPFERIEKIILFWEGLNGEFTLEPICITPAEMAVYIYTPFFWEIFEYGKIIFDNGILQKYLQLFTKLKKSQDIIKLERDGWSFSDYVKDEYKTQIALINSS